MRGDRELAFGQDLSIFLKNDNFNYLRGEIRFPIINGDTRIDDLFGVQTMKSSIDINPRLLEKLRSILQRPIERMRQTQRSTRKKAAASKRRTMVAKAEKHSAALRKHSPRPKRTSAEINKLRDEFSAHKKRVIQREDTKAGTLLVSADEKLAQAQASGDTSRIKHAEIELEKAKAMAEEIKETVRNRFAFEPGKDSAPMYMLDIESPYGTDDLSPSRISH